MSLLRHVIKSYAEVKELSYCFQIVAWLLQGKEDHSLVFYFILTALERMGWLIMSSHNRRQLMTELTTKGNGRMLRMRHITRLQSMSLSFSFSPGMFDIATVEAMSGIHSEALAYT